MPDLQLEGRLTPGDIQEWNSESTLEGQVPCLKGDSIPGGQLFMLRCLGFMPRGPSSMSAGLGLADGTQCMTDRQT